MQKIFCKTTAQKNLLTKWKIILKNKLLNDFLWSLQAASLIEHTAEALGCFFVVVSFTK